jgi:hypothetical protein
LRTLYFEHFTLLFLRDQYSFLDDYGVIHLQ